MPRDERILRSTVSKAEDMLKERIRSALWCSSVSISERSPYRERQVCTHLVFMCNSGTTLSARVTISVQVAAVRYPDKSKSCRLRKSNLHMWKYAQKASNHRYRPPYSANPLVIIKNGSTNSVQRQKIPFYFSGK